MQSASQISTRHAGHPFLAQIGWIIVAILGCGLPQAAAQESLRVGVVDPQAIMEQSAYGKRELAALKEHVTARQKILTSDEEELSALEEKIQEGQEAGSKNLASLRQKHQRNFRKYQDRIQTFQDELSEKRSNMTSEYMERLQIAIKAVAEEKGFSFIVTKANEATGTQIVLYSSKELDVTKDVLKEFEKLYP